MPHRTAIGYAELLAALDEAHQRPGVNNTVRVTTLGDNAGSWDIVTGDHLERDGTVHLGGGIRILPDSTIAGTDGMVVGRGGHVMSNGDTLMRFALDGVATTLEWNDPDQAVKAA